MNLNFLAKIPWKPVLQAWPAITQGLGKLHEMLRGIASLEKLEGAVAEQAKLTEQLADQVKKLSLGLQVVAARIALLMAVSFVAFLLALVVAVKVFLF